MSDYNTKGKPKTGTRKKHKIKTRDGMVSTQLTDKQRTFANLLLQGKTQTQAAELAYNTTNKNIARTIGSQNLIKPDIQSYLLDRGYTAIDEIYNIGLDRTNKTSDRLTALRDIADRAGHTPVKKTEVKQQTVNIDLTFTNAEIDD